MMSELADRKAHLISEKIRTVDVAFQEDVRFSNLLISDNVLQGLQHAGFYKPSPIQLKAIPLGRCGLDLIVQAKSGTGKTCVFTVIALEGLVAQSRSLQVLILAPTREIAAQIQDVIQSVGRCVPGLQCHTFIGGLPLSEDKQKLKKCHIAVGSPGGKVIPLNAALPRDITGELYPGRIKQLIEENVMSTDNIRLFILDEADKLLEESFQEQINWIYSTLPENKQMLALSATYPEYLAHHLQIYMRNPTFVRLNSTDPALLGVKQFYKVVRFHPLPHVAFENKVKHLVQLLSCVEFHQCLIFSNFQSRAETLAKILNSQGLPSTCIAGCLDQKQRLEAMAKLRNFECRVLISTDLTSRGIDVDKINLVINLDLPKDHETYLHRIGRAGRFGSYGVAITYVCHGKEEGSLERLEEACNTFIQRLPDPTPNDLVRDDKYLQLVVPPGDEDRKRPNRDVAEEKYTPSSDFNAFSRFQKSDKVGNEKLEDRKTVIGLFKADLDSPENSAEINGQLIQNETLQKRYVDQLCVDIQESQEKLSISPSRPGGECGVRPNDNLSKEERTLNSAEVETNYLESSFLSSTIDLPSIQLCTRINRGFSFKDVQQDYLFFIEGCNETKPCEDSSPEPEERQEQPEDGRPLKSMAIRSEYDQCNTATDYSSPEPEERQERPEDDGPLKSMATCSEYDQCNTATDYSSPEPEERQERPEDDGPLKSMATCSEYDQCNTATDSSPEPEERQERPEDDRPLKSMAIRSEYDQCNTATDGANVNQLLHSEGLVNEVANLLQEVHIRYSHLASPLTKYTVDSTQNGSKTKPLCDKHTQTHHDPDGHDVVCTKLHLSHNQSSSTQPSPCEQQNAAKINNDQPLETKLSDGLHHSPYNLDNMSSSSDFDDLSNTDDSDCEDDKVYQNLTDQNHTGPKNQFYSHESEYYDNNLLCAEQNDIEDSTLQNSGPYGHGYQDPYYGSPWYGYYGDDLTYTYPYSGQPMDQCCLQAWYYSYLSQMYYLQMMSAKP